MRVSTRAPTARALRELPPNVRFVASDFTHSDLQSQMIAAGYCESLHTFILWEGVTNYLTEAAVDATLRWRASYKDSLRHD